MFRRRFLSVTTRPTGGGGGGGGAAPSGAAVPPIATDAPVKVLDKAVAAVMEEDDHRALSQRYRSGSLINDGARARRTDGGGRTED